MIYRSYSAICVSSTHLGIPLSAETAWHGDNFYFVHAGWCAWFVALVHGSCLLDRGVSRRGLGWRARYKVLAQQVFHSISNKNEVVL